MGLRFTEAIIQQHGLIDHKMLSVLKDFGHLMLDKEPDFKDGRYVFSVPELKLALMGNVSVRTVSRNLKALDEAHILEKVQDENPDAGTCAIYGLRLPDGFDVAKLSKPYFGTIFGGVKWEEALKAYNAREGSRKQPKQQVGDMLPPVRDLKVSLDKMSTQQHQDPTNLNNNTTTSSDVVDNTRGYLSFGGAMGAIEAEIRRECPGFNLDTAMMRNMTDRDIPAVRNALKVFKVQKLRHEKSGEPMESPAAYLARLIQQGRSGKLTFPNPTDAEGQVVETIGDPEFFFRWILNRYGLWNIHNNRPLYDIGKITLELKPKLMPLLKDKKQSEVENWCRKFESTIVKGSLLTKDQYYEALMAYC